MKLNTRTFAISLLSGGLLAIGSSVAIAQTVNNIDNTTPGMAGHGTGCSNFLGGCRPADVSTSHGAYQPSNDLGAGTMPSSSMNPSSTMPGTGTPYVGCTDAADATPGHCIRGGTNK